MSNMLSPETSGRIEDIKSSFRASVRSALVPIASRVLSSRVCQIGGNTVIGIGAVSRYGISKDTQVNAVGLLAEMLFDDPVASMDNSERTYREGIEARDKAISFLKEKSKGIYQVERAASVDSISGDSIEQLGSSMDEFLEAMKNRSSIEGQVDIPVLISSGRKGIRIFKMPFKIRGRKTDLEFLREVEVNPDYEDRYVRHLRIQPVGESFIYLRSGTETCVIDDTGIGTTWAFRLLKERQERVGDVEVYRMSTNSFGTTAYIRGMDITFDRYARTITLDADAAVASMLLNPDKILKRYGLIREMRAKRDKVQARYRKARSMKSRLSDRNWTNENKLVRLFNRLGLEEKIRKWCN